MIQVNGKYNQAIIYTDVVDEASIAQVKELCNQEFSVGQRIRLMPDIHAGAGCTIGTTMTLNNKVVPNLVGVDIGCGMAVAVLKERHIELEKLDKVIRQYVPAGFEIRDARHRFADDVELENLRCAKHVNLDRAAKSIGTLGGGNHFIEVDQDDEGTLYLVVHTGSRHLGVEIASTTSGLPTKNSTNPRQMMCGHWSINSRQRASKNKSKVKSKNSRIQSVRTFRSTSRMLKGRLSMPISTTCGLHSISHR